jgi:outer membrane protein TolC
LADLERADQVLEATRRDLGVRIHREYRGVTEGVMKVHALEQAVRSAQQAVISSRRSFEAGSRTLVDVLNAEQQQASALRDLSQARYLYLVSRVRLQALAGGTPSGVLDEVNGWLNP